MVEASRKRSRCTSEDERRESEARFRELTGGIPYLFAIIYGIVVFIRKPSDEDFQSPEFLCGKIIMELML